LTLRILVTNDDGINAPGLAVAEKIASELAGSTGKVVTIAPSIDQSGVSHSISYLRPSLIEKHNDSRYSVEGSPADCVLAGVYHIMKDYKPNLILSGVNNGYNLAEDILYSGTVGAAMEGALQGIKSIAMSQCYSKESLSLDNRFESAKAKGANICLKLLNSSIWNSKPYQVFYNVNFPAIKPAEIKGISLCKQGRRPKGSFSMNSMLSPNGRTFLMVNHRPDKLLENTNSNKDSDLEKINNNFITITPLHAELTDYCHLENLKKIFQNES